METSETNLSDFISGRRTVSTVESLTRIHNVTGQAFPISGDAQLRMKAKLIASANYGKDTK